MKRYKTVLSIAGSDSGGGAGIQADIKAASACGCYAMTVVTAVTCQNTRGVSGVHAVPPAVVAAQLRDVLEDIGADAVKLGMLPTAGCVEAVAPLLREYGAGNVVLDPVMVATSGDRLIAEEAVEAIRRHLFPLAELITPNIPEAEFLTGLTIRSGSDFEAAAGALLAQGARGVLIKSGHLEGALLEDRLFTPEGTYAFGYERINTHNTHGTGCTLSSAIASFLALDYSLPEAVGLAEDYIHKAILCGREYRLGHGHGPVHHFYRFWE